MVFVASLVILVIFYFFVFDLQFCLCLVHGHPTLLVISCFYWFPWFSSCLFLSLSFYVVRAFGIRWGKRKVNETWGELNETPHVI